MLYKYYSYFKYLLLSKNQHGVHSPFVYDLITKSIYTQSKKNNPKKSRIIHGVLNHYKIKSYKKIGHPLTNIDSIKIKNTNDSYDIIHLENPIMALPLDFETNQLFIIEKIHENHSFENAWELLLQKQSSIVSLDFFELGIVFVKTTQAKEHFVLRA